MVRLTSLNARFLSLAQNLSHKQVNAGSELNRMASGKRLQQSSDDVASMSVSTFLKARSATLKVVLDNVRQADNLLQIADKGLSSIQDILDRMAALSVQSNSGSVTLQERYFLHQEFQHLKQEIDRIAQTTNFNGQHLLNGEMMQVPGDPLPAVEGVAITGVDTAETIYGTADDDILQGLAGDDIINSNGGNDTFLPSVGTILGVQGRIYRSASSINNLTQAEAVVATQPVWATFIGTSLDYPVIGNSSSGNVNSFLSGDSGSLVGGSGTTAMYRMVYVFDGTLNVPADGNYTFSVGSDDGFNLRIDGTTVMQFTNNRAFGTTTGNRFLTAGEHNFRLLYWEEAGDEGMLARSNLGGAGLQVLNTTHLQAPAALTDGNDTLNGSATGQDVAVYDGNESDYTITQLSPTQFQITDNRLNSPNGTDILNDINILRFANGEREIIPRNDPVPPMVDAPRTINYIVSETGTDYFSYTVIDTRLSALFADPDALEITTNDNAAAAFDAILNALDNVTDKRAYVGAKMQQANFIFSGSLNNLNEKQRAYSLLADTDIALSSSQYATLIAQVDASVLVQVQAMQLHEEVVLRLLTE
jgi:flagellin-like hook-associated protein FlgL